MECSNLGTLGGSGPQSVTSIFTQSNRWVSLERYLFRIFLHNNLQCSGQFCGGCLLVFIVHNCISKVHFSAAFVLLLHLCCKEAHTLGLDKVRLFYQNSSSKKGSRPQGGVAGKQCRMLRRQTLGLWPTVHCFQSTWVFRPLESVELLVGIK